MVVFKLNRPRIDAGRYHICRFILIIFYSTILTVTTTPLSLADAVERDPYTTKIIKGSST